MYELHHGMLSPRDDDGHTFHIHSTEPSAEGIISSAVVSVMESVKRPGSHDDHEHDQDDGDDPREEHFQIRAILTSPDSKATG